jgi:3-oxoacyl-[acyl-carrier protein] reductase
MNRTLSSENRVAIVTGASRGIGAEIARQLARDGFAVVVNYVHNATAAKQVVGEIEQIAGADRPAGPAATAIQADISDQTQVDRLFAESERIYGGVNVLVANAGVQAPRPMSIAETENAVFDHLIGVNFRGTFYLLREAARRLRPDGRVVTISSSALGLKVPGQAVYNACKAATEVMTALLAKELGDRGITVNAVAPGPTATQLFLQRSSEATVQHLTRQTPLGRVGAPADVARVVAMLVKDDGAWVNGQTIRANGGLV